MFYQKLNTSPVPTASFSSTLVLSSPFFFFNFISESCESLARCQVSIYTFPKLYLKRKVLGDTEGKEQDLAEKIRIPVLHPQPFSQEQKQANHAEQQRTVFRTDPLCRDEKDPQVSLYALRAWRFIQLLL